MQFNQLVHITFFRCTIGIPFSTIRLCSKSYSSQNSITNICSASCPSEITSHLRYPRLLVDFKLSTPSYLLLTFYMLFI